MIENDKHPKKWVRQTDPCPIVICEDKKPPFGRKKVFCTLDGRLLVELWGVASWEQLAEALFSIALV